MQKIVFVGIILIIGLFSLQYSISDIYSSATENKQNTITVHKILYKTEVVYVCPVDSLNTDEITPVICEPMPL